jgi:hypothetical protein
MFYKDVAHEPLRHVVPTDLRTHRTTHSDSASSSSSANSSFLKMFWGIFAMFPCMDQRMDVMEQCLQIVWHN